MSSLWITRSSLLAGAAAAIGASACCAGPLVLVLIGVGGAWGSRLLALAPLQPFFVAAAVAAFGFAFHRLYLQRVEVCAPGQVCAIPAVRTRQRVIFWILAVAATALMTFPLYAELFY